jgi:CRP-like cAMP-binding protein
VKLYAENDYSFETYIKGDQFGEGEVFSAIKRIGTARAFEVDNLLYSISSYQMDIILGEFPLIKRNLLKQSIVTT